MAKKVKNSASLVIFTATLTRNGKVVTSNSIDYLRREFEDGTVEERGRPAGVKRGAGVGEVIGAALNQLAVGAAAAPTAKPVKSRVRKR